MLFLVSFTNFDIRTAALGVFRNIIFTIDEIVYKLIIVLYDIFYALCDAEILNNELISTISRRIGIILGLVMFFYVAFDIVQVMLDPDKISDKEKGPMNVIMKVVIVVVLLGTSSYLFGIMSDVQSTILGEDIIGKIILPYDVDSSNFGRVLSAQFMKSFYQMDTSENASTGTVVDDLDYETCLAMTDAFYNQIVNSGEFSLGYNCLNERYEYSDSKAFYIDFNFLSIVVGIFVAWMLITYCISVGMRVIQIALLQIISPIAIVGYLSPKKDNMLSKWFKIYFATYIDVFIRIAVIDLIVLMCALILDNWGDTSSGFWATIKLPDGSTPSSTMLFWIGVFMIMALLSFARKAPELLKEFLPESASKLGFGVGLSGHEGLGMIGGALAGSITGLIGGAASGNSIGTRITGALGGVVGGVGRGFAGGAKGKDLRGALTEGAKGQAQANLARSQRVTSGVTMKERAADGFRGLFGMEAGYAANDSRLSAMNSLNSLINDEDVVKDAQNQRDSAYEYLTEAESKYGKGSEEYNRAFVAVKNSDARLSAIKNAMFDSIVDGQARNRISYDGFALGADGKIIKQRQDEATITEITANKSMKNAKDNVDKVMKKTYLNRKQFKDDRQSLQAESQRLHKSGK